MGDNLYFATNQHKTVKGCRGSCRPAVSDSHSLSPDNPDLKNEQHWGGVEGWGENADNYN